MAKKVYLTTKSGKAWRASLVPPKEGERSKVFETENGIAYDLQRSEEKGGGVTPLGPTTATFTAGATSGSLIALVTGLQSGETITGVTPNDGRLAIAGSGTQLVVGLSASSAGNIAAVLTSSAGRTLNMAITVEAGGVEPQPLPMPQTVSSVVGFGDSITVGLNSSDAAHRWLNIVSISLSAGAPLNQGISGTVLQRSADSTGSPRAQNGRDRFESALLGANKREMIFISYGFNDARYIGAPATFNVTRYKNDYRDVMNGLLAGGYTQDRICVVTPYYITDTGLVSSGGNAEFTGQSRAGFEEYVQAAKDIAAEFGVYLADTYSAMRDNGGASLISNDNIHPTDNGHSVIATAVLAASRTPVTLPATMIFVQDSFADTEGANLSAHFSDSGSAWLGSTTSPVINAGRVRSANASTTYRASGTPRSANYQVRADFNSITDAGQSAIFARHDGASTFYYVSYLAGTGFRLYKIVAGVSAQLGSTYAATIAAGSSRAVVLEVKGSAIKVLVDGVERISVTDTDIAGPGRAGVRFQSTQAANTGIHLDNFVAETLAA